MQVVILCGGLGTRIREVTEELPKPMIPIGGKPILWHIMNRYAHYGFRDFVLCLGYKGWSIKNYFLNHHLSQADLRIDMSRPGDIEVLDQAKREDWRVTLAETGQDTMTGGRVQRIARYIQDEHFLLTYGDGVADIDISRLVDFHLSHGKIGTVTTVTPPSRFGEVEHIGSEIREFSEKPVASRGRINGGYFVFRRDFFERLDDNPRLVLEREPLQELARDGQLAGYRHEGFWQCMDNSRDYQDLNALWDAGEARWQPTPTTVLRRAA